MIYINTVLYTTHLASMGDPAYPERVRIVETSENHATIKKGVVSNQRAPMAVIELSLGLAGGYERPARDAPDAHRRGRR